MEIEKKRNPVLTSHFSVVNRGKSSKLSVNTGESSCTAIEMIDLDLNLLIVF